MPATAASIEHPAMLMASGEIALRDSALHTTIFLERRFRVHVVRRDRLLFDNRFAVPARKENAAAHLFVALQGTCELPNGARVSSPCAFVLTGSELEGPAPQSARFRLWGEPFSTVDLRLRVEDLRAPVGLARGPLSLPPDVWAACEALAETRSSAHVVELVRRLADAGLVAPDLVSSVIEQEPERFARLWSVIRECYAALATGLLVKEIARGTKLSVRQATRDLRDLIATFDVLGAGYRDAARVLRLRSATVLLSAPSATPSEVAQAVGYGSLSAMDRAFRDARLPAPTQLQSLVRYEVA